MRGQHRLHFSDCNEPSALMFTAPLPVFHAKQETEVTWMGTVEGEMVLRRKKKKKSLNSAREWKTLKSAL